MATDDLQDLIQCLKQENSGLKVKLRGGGAKVQQMRSALRGG